MRKSYLFIVLWQSDKDFSDCLGWPNNKWLWWPPYQRPNNEGTVLKWLLNASIKSDRIEMKWEIEWNEEDGASVSLWSKSCPT